MEAINKEFVEEKLSRKSSFYINNELFQKTHRILAKMMSLTDYDKDKIFIVGDLNQVHFELYIIMYSLSLRILGTRERIEDMVCIKDNDMIDLLNQRNKRLQELGNDWITVRRQLYTLLEISHSKELEKVKSENTILLKTEFHWSDYSSYSGYDYVFFKERKFGITNHYAIGGD